MLSDVEVSDISQRYRMNGVLGSGAQATVYAGLSKKNQQKVAIKVSTSCTATSRQRTSSLAPRARR